MIATDRLNITPLTDQLWTGGDLPEPLSDAAAHVRAWARRGISHVIDCRSEWTDQALIEAVEPTVRYTHIGIDDGGQRVPNAWFEAVAGAAIETIRSGGTALVHCHRGINRGPSGAIAVLLALGWQPVRAIDHVRRQRPVAAVAYAEDALDWWHEASCAPPDERALDIAGLHQWRLDHPHPTSRIMRQIRRQA